MSPFVKRTRAILVSFSEASSLNKEFLSRCYVKRNMAYHHCSSQKALIALIIKIFLNNNFKHIVKKIYFKFYVKRKVNYYLQ